MPTIADLQSGDYKLISGKRKKLVTLEVTDTKIVFDFGYDEYLKDEIKVMDGARWNPDTKQWSAKNNRHNRWQLAFLLGLNPYDRYEKPLIEFEPRIPVFQEGKPVPERGCLYPQQYQMAREGLTYRQVIWAAEMGLGKTLAAFMVIENSEAKEWWWVGPRSALAAYEVELERWGLLRNFPTEVMTYEGLVKLLMDWPPGKSIPGGVIFDESSRGKTPGTKRSQAMWALAEKMRDTYGDEFPYIIEMTGTPAPKTPADWFWQCEIACPGFIREGDIYKFKNRLAVIEREQNPQTGGFYPKLIAWKDSTERCSICGIHKEQHDFSIKGMEHRFVPGVNEVAKLYKRMKGLVSVYYKKDWMKFLPEKQYRVLRCKVSRSAQNAAQAVKNSSKTAIEAMTRLRELSDGFQYEDTPSGNYSTCELCHGSKRVRVPDYVEEELAEDAEVKMVEIDCTNCNATGLVENITRVTNRAGCPKDDLLDEIMDDHEDGGRLVVYAGFTGSIDRIQEIATRKGWEWVRVDGRGWNTSLIGKLKPKDMLQAFQDKKRKVSKLIYIAHPQSGGMGVTLTESPEIVFFSNDFNAESRIQAEDRIHRPGMDLNKGATITDLVHLPSDELVLENLREKRRLQDMSLGQFQASLAMLTIEENRR